MFHKQIRGKRTNCQLASESPRHFKTLRGHYAALKRLCPHMFKHISTLLPPTNYSSTNMEKKLLAHKHFRSNFVVSSAENTLKHMRCVTQVSISTETGVKLSICFTSLFQWESQTLNSTRTQPQLTMVWL